MRLSSFTPAAAFSGQKQNHKRGNSSSWPQPSMRTSCSKTGLSALGCSYTESFQLQWQNPGAPSFTQLTPLHWRCGSWQERSDTHPPDGQRRWLEGDAANLSLLHRGGRPGCSLLETGRDTRHPAPSRASNCKQTAGWEHAGVGRRKLNKTTSHRKRKKRDSICKHIKKNAYSRKVKLELQVTRKSGV